MEITDLPFEILSVLMEYCGESFGKLRSTCKIFDAVANESLRCMLLIQTEDRSFKTAELWMKLESNYGHVVEGPSKKFLAEVEEGDKSFWLSALSTVRISVWDREFYDECKKAMDLVIGFFKVCAHNKRLAMEYSVVKEIYDGISEIVENSQINYAEKIFSILPHELCLNQQQRDEMSVEEATKPVPIGKKTLFLSILPTFSNFEYTFPMECTNLSVVELFAVHWHEILDTLELMFPKTPFLKK